MQKCNKQSQSVNLLFFACDYFSTLMGKMFVNEVKSGANILRPRRLLK